MRVGGARRLRTRPSSSGRWRGRVQPRGRRAGRTAARRRASSSPRRARRRPARRVRGWCGSRRASSARGAPLDEVPRLADVELPGVDVPLGGFYMDVLPWPERGGGHPDDERVAATRRRCSARARASGSARELEWERACKGPSNTRYEYGATYDAHVCGAGRRRRHRGAAPERRQGRVQERLRRARDARRRVGVDRLAVEPRRRGPAGGDAGRRPRRQRRRGRARDAVRVREGDAAAGVAIAGDRLPLLRRAAQRRRGAARREGGRRPSRRRCTRRARRRRSMRSEARACGPPLRAVAVLAVARVDVASGAERRAVAGGRLPRARPERALRHRACRARSASASRRWRRSTRAARSPRSCWSRGWTGASACGARTCRASSSARSSSATAAST